jgi:serine/threonine protein kinase
MPCNFFPFRRSRSSREAEMNDPSANFPKAHRYDGLIQKGSQGYVEQWTHVQSSTIVAVKVISPQNPPSPEVEVLRDLPPHNSIVKYLGHYEKLPSAERVSILFEHCPLGDLYMVRSLSIEEGKYLFSEKFMWSVFWQVMSAFAYLHEGIDALHPTGRENWRPIVHRDLKFENILVKTLGHKEDWSSIVVKLADFGMAGYHDPDHPNPTGYIGTTHYWPPEVTWETRRLTPASDVWGVAAIMHELAHNFAPIVDPALTEANWFASGKQAPYPEHWSITQRKNYWASKTPRRVVPINLDIGTAVPSLSDPALGGDDKLAMTFRKRRPSPKYSDTLNECMMAGLAMLPEERLESGKLLRLIEEGYAEFLFQNLRLDLEQETALERTDSSAQMES